MKRDYRSRICLLLIIIILLSIVLIYKIRSTPKYDETLYNEIYKEYNEILKNIDEQEDNNNKKNNNTIHMIVNSKGDSYRVEGTIKIPKIEINYPVMYKTTEEYLKIAPTKFYGPNINEIGNVCITGHNYKNDQFFSRLSELEKNDRIYLMNNAGKELVYAVYDKFETDETDLSCMNQETNGNIELTLITCANKRKNRLIIKCRVIEK